MADQPIPSLAENAAPGATGILHVVPAAAADDQRILMPRQVANFRAIPLISPPAAGDYGLVAQGGVASKALLDDIILMSEKVGSRIPTQNFIIVGAKGNVAGSGTIVPGSTNWFGAGSRETITPSAHMEPTATEGPGLDVNSTGGAVAFRGGVGAGYCTNKGIELVCRVGSSASGDAGWLAFVGFQPPGTDIINTTRGAGWNGFNFLGFHHNQTDPFWIVASGDGVAWTNHGNTTIAGNDIAPHTFKIVGNDAGTSFDFFIDGVLQKTVTTGLPAAGTVLEANNSLSYVSANKHMLFYYFHAKTRAAIYEY